MAANKLLTKELREQLPALYATEATPMAEKLAVAKFFTPDSNWTWYAVEFDGNDTFFGYVQGFENEFGYFSLSELQDARGPLGLPIERDLYFEPTPLAELDSNLRADAEVETGELAARSDMAANGEDTKTISVRVVDLDALAEEEDEEWECNR